MASAPNHGGAMEETMTPTRPNRAAFKTLGLIAASLAAGLLAGVYLIGGRGGDAPAHSEAASHSARPGGGMHPPAVTLVRPKIKPVEQTLTAIGTGRAIQSLTLTSDVAGLVEKIHIKPGQSVEAGAPLIELEKDQQEIAVARARADYDVAKTNAARFAGLVQEEAASALEYESAKNALSAATAQLRQAEFDLSQRTIRAPFTGVVGLTGLDIGDYVTTGSKITTIDDVSALLVDFVIPEKASTYVTKGLEVAAYAPASGGRPVKGSVRAVDSRIDPATRTRRVEAILANERHQLIPGATFTITLVAPGRSAIEAPGLAVQWDRAGSYVWKVGDNGAAVRTPVTILQRNPDSVLLDAELAPTDRIVAEGADSVREGTPLVDRSGESASTAAASSSAF